MFQQSSKEYLVLCADVVGSFQNLSLPAEGSWTFDITVNATTNFSEIYHYCFHSKEDKPADRRKNIQPVNEANYSSSIVEMYLVLRCGVENWLFLLASTPTEGIPIAFYAKVTQLNELGNSQLPVTITVLALSIVALAINLATPTMIIMEGTA